MTSSQNPHGGTPAQDATPTRYHYFVDEAGDFTCFDKRGRVIVGEEGVSKCIMVGAALIYDPVGLEARLEALRTELLGDPYFAGVPSMRPDGRKTASLFHAKDDVAEVRYRVLTVLRDVGGVDIYAAFRRKSVLAEEMRAYHQRTGRALKPDAMYDDLVSDIFKDRLHQGDANHIVFARRGKADRNLALGQAVEKAKQRFERKWRKGIDRPTTLTSDTPDQVLGLQVIDYYLWVLQRMIETGEDRFFNLLAPAYRLVIDRDDTRHAGYGEYYSSKKNPLILEKLMPIT